MNVTIINHLLLTYVELFHDESLLKDQPPQAYRLEITRRCLMGLGGILPERQID